MNGLIMIEIFFSFIVLFAVLSTTIYFYTNYRHPLGYTIERVWSIRVRSNLPFRSHRKEKAEGMKQLSIALRDLPEIESVGGISAAPYAHSTWISGTEYKGRNVNAEMLIAGDGIKDVLDVRLTSGRWFTAEDDDTTFKPAVINERLAHELFGSENPIGKETPFTKTRVIGVVSDFRKGGAFAQLDNYHIARLRTDDTTSNVETYTLLIKVRPGTTAAFQERLVKVLESVEKGWTYDVTQLERERDEDLKVRLAPLLAGAIVAGFLLSMVALGLIGVLWQNVSQRIGEIGLRRALGGTPAHLARQIQGEQFVITSIGVTAASGLVLQIPLLNLTDGAVNTEVFLVSLVVSLVVMFGLTYFCSMFPGWLAMQIEPAEALHYE
jgi:putative ABC transport system permease protein